VRGTVMFRSGDLMPPIDHTRSKITPLVAGLQFFRGRVRGDDADGQGGGAS